MENAVNGLYLPPIKKWKLRKILSVEYLFSCGFGFMYLNTMWIQRKNSSFLKSIPTVPEEACAEEVRKREKWNERNRNKVTVWKFMFYQLLVVYNSLNTFHYTFPVFGNFVFRFFHFLVKGINIFFCNTTRIKKKTHLFICW